MNNKELFQKKMKHPYAAPEVTVVEFHIERGFLFSTVDNSNIERRNMGIQAWDYAPDYQSESRSFGDHAW